MTRWPPTIATTFNDLAHVRHGRRELARLKRMAAERGLPTGSRLPGWWLDMTAVLADVERRLDDEEARLRSAGTK